MVLFSKRVFKMRFLGVLLAIFAVSFATNAKAEAPPDGTLELNSVIGASTLEPIAKKMDELKAAGAKKIFIRINSPGGEMDSGMKFVQKIESFGIPVVCIADNKAYSMA